MIYLDNAATSYPKPPAVYEEADRFLKELGANPGRSGHKMAIGAERVISQTRNLVAKFFNINDPTRLIFTLNTTDALNMGVKGLLREGDHVVTSYLEHNSVSRPLRSLEEKGVISVTKVEHSDEGFVDPDDVKKVIEKKTRLIVLTHASNVIGVVQPIGDIGGIAREHDVAFMVDAAQTAGAWPIDVEAARIDMLAFPGHKSLLGPPGTGGLYIGERVDISPWREGGTGTDSESPIQPEELPYKLEGGTPNTVGIAGLKAGVTFILEQGLDKIRQHEQSLLLKLIEGLCEDERFTLYGLAKTAPQNLPKDDDGFVLSVCTLSLNVKGWETAELGGVLDQSFEIAVRTGLHCAPYIHQKMSTFPDGTVRFSPGYFNTTDDIETALSALREIGEAGT